MNNINNNVNFTARMDIRKVSINKDRWKNIAQIFEQKTAKYPNDTFKMEDLPNGISGYNFNNKNANEICANITGVEFDRLLNMSDSTIVSKFKKMLDISAKKQKIYDATNQYIEKLSKAAKNSEINETNIWYKAADIAEKETKALQNKDNFLKDVDIMF